MITIAKLYQMLQEECDIDPVLEYEDYAEYLECEVQSYSRRYNKITVTCQDFFVVNGLYITFEFVTVIYACLYGRYEGCRCWDYPRDGLPDTTARLVSVTGTPDEPVEPWQPDQIEQALQHYLREQYGAKPDGTLLVNPFPFDKQTSHQFLGYFPRVASRCTSTFGEKYDCWYEEIDAR